MGSICISDTLRALSDDKSVVLFNMVAFTLSRDTDAVMTRLGFTRKQYYSRIKRLLDAGLVMRKSGKYFLTSFGEVVYESYMLIGQAIENYWKLKAIDSIETLLPDKDLSAEERKSLIDNLIKSDNIKNILLNHKIPLEAPKSVAVQRSVISAISQ